VTSDILPTLAEITGQPLPDRPLDGISLAPFFKEPAKQRPKPVCFWEFNIDKVFGQTPQPYIDPELQEGTTPLAKLLAGKYTRNFLNYHFTRGSEYDFSGERTILNGSYKLMMEGQTPNKNGFELYDIQKDPGEVKNLADEYPEIVKKMQNELAKWQESVLKSLSEADYKKAVKARKM
jgi:arylsulfatase A-like enzyme